MRFVRGIKILICVVLFVIVFGLLVEHLWNWLMPMLFGLRTITYWQALGLLVLSKILFGGVHRHGGRGGWDRRRDWKRRMKQRWERMTPEEKERFKAGMKGRWGCDFGHERHGFGRDAFDSRDFDRREEPVREKGTV